MVKQKFGNGYYIFKLDDLMRENKVSTNKLMRETNTDYSVIKNLKSGDLMRVDLFVISRFCNYFNCNINDIIEYIND